MNFSNREDTICALATAPGMAALAVIRISGPKSFSIIEEIFTSIKGKKKDFEKIKTYSLHFGKIIDQDQIIDEILVSVFKGTSFIYGRRHHRNFLSWLYLHSAIHSSIVDSLRRSHGRSG
jgi:hypothetical protein